MKHRHLAATAGAVVFCLAIPTASSAATRDVYMGTPPSISKTLQDKYFSDANAYFPATTKIHVGDTVRFLPVGFHNLDLPRKGGSATGLFAAAKPADEKDAAGQPFWFNGQPTFSFNPVLGPPGLFGKSVSYDGSKGVQSGLPLADKPKPVRVKFNKTGSFTYYCTVHAGMKGKVQVVSRRASAPSARAHKAALARATARALQTAKGLAKRKAPSLGITVGVADRSGVERFVFSPSKRTVKVGDTLTFKMGTHSYEVHTATTGPGDAEKKGTYLGDVAAAFEGDTFSGIAIYPSDNPALGNATLTSKHHGNGFWSTGVLDTNKSSPIGDNGSVKFGEAGTYTFICLLHPFMKATVTATA